MRKVDPLILSEKEIDIIESIIGRETIWMFNKVWDERIAARYFKGEVIRTIEICRANNQVETKYWEYKEKEVDTVIAHQTKVMMDVMTRLEGNIDVALWRKITDYVKTES